MKEPIGVLPFYIEDNDFIKDSNDEIVTDLSFTAYEDAEYIIQACNAFPRAIELLEEVMGELTYIREEGQLLKSQINEFLTKLKENE